MCWILVLLSSICLLFSFYQSLSACHLVSFFFHLKGLHSTLAATARETHSVKWTAKIGVFYTVAALLISCVVYHIGLLVF